MSFDIFVIFEKFWNFKPLALLLIFSDKLL